MKEKNINSARLRNAFYTSSQEQRMSRDSTTDAVAAALRERISTDWTDQTSDAAVDALIAALCSEDGKRALQVLVNDVAAFEGRVIRVDAWVQGLAEDSGRSELQDFKQRVGVILEPVLEQFRDALKVPQSDEVLAVGGIRGASLASAVKILQKLASDYKIPIQFIESLDDLQGIDVEPFLEKFGRAPRDGVIAAVLTLAMSAAINIHRYNRGKIRWDDAIDKVIGDTLKAGITGVILSAIASSLTVTPPLAIAVMIVLAPVVHAVV